jgi:hypothetical protein
MPIKILKKTENPMASERFYQQRREALIDSGIPANMIDKFNATPNKLDASRILKKRKEKFKKAENPMADERFNAAFRSRMKKAGLKDSEIGDTRFKAGGLSGGQAKLAAKAPPPNKIDAKDFAVLKAEKAKGRGMGLQDEKIKPGKVMKAKTGKQIVKEFSASLKGIDESFKSKVHPMKKQRLLDRSTVMTKAKYGKMMKARVGKSIDKKAYFKTIGVFPNVSSAAGGKGSGTGGRDTRTLTEKGQFIKRRMELAGPKNITPLKVLGKVATSRAGALGAILGAGVVGLNIAGKKLKEFADKKKDKKMGGGMMNKPMGYSSGTKLMDFIKSGSYTDKYGTKTNVDKAIKKINLSPKDKDLATMKPASDKKMMGGGMMQGKIYKASEGIMLSAYKRPTMSIQEGAAKARERNKKQDERKKEIDKAAKKYRVGGGGANRYGPHKVDVNRQATEALLGRGPIQEKIIKFADKFNKRIKTKKMVGGMAKKYSVGGGMMQRPMGGPMGGMMQRPMGYKHGTKPGAGPLGAAGLRQPAKENIDQIIKDQKFPPISIYIEDKKKPQKPFPVPSLYNNNKKPDKRIREDEPRAKKMGEPKGFKSGTMVKARGCKLGRTRPTKMY